MEAYGSVYSVLGLSKELIDVCQGDLVLPVPSVDQPSRWYGGPPGVIPLWSSSDGPLSWALWIKNLPPKLSATYVTCHPEAGYRVVEIARTQDQLMMEICLEEITREEGITPEIRDFAQAVGIDNSLDRIFNVAVETGDDLKGLLSLTEFRDNPPLVCTVGYNRSLLDTDTDFDDPIILSGIASLELDKKAYAVIVDKPVAPPWLRKHADQNQVFDEMLGRGDIQACWKCLNSTGWRYSDTRVAVERLARVSHDELLLHLGEAWCSMDHEEYGEGYGGGY